MRTTRLFAAPAAIALLLACACNDAASAEDADRYCQAYCDRRARCGGADADCFVKCRQEADPAALAYRSCYFEGAADCEVSRPCSGVGGDFCDSAGVMACGQPLNDEHYAQCMAVRSSCRAAGKPSYSDNYCSNLPALNDDARARFTSCFNLACEDQSNCAKAAIGD